MNGPDGRGQGLPDWARTGSSGHRDSRAVHVLIELVLGSLQCAPGLGVVGDCDGGPQTAQKLE